MEMVARQNKIRRIHPKKFALWISMLSMIMLFSAFTSAYIVQKAAGDWLQFPLPVEFFYSTGVILACSLFLHMAYKSFVNKNYLYYQLFWSLGLFLALLFVALQYQGWLHLNEWEIFVHTNQSSSFFVMLVGAHALHVLGGIAALMTSWILAFRKNTKEWSDKGQLRLELTCTYWHFVDVLWLYLLAFLWFQQ